MNKRIRLDASRLTNREDMSNYMQQVFDFPEYFGRNSGDSDEKQEDEKQADEQMFSGVYAGPKPVKGIISKIKDKLKK